MRLSLNQRAVLVIHLVCGILTGQLLKVQAYTCKVRRERLPNKDWRWVLPYPNPCECTRVIMTAPDICPPYRPFVPVYSDTPLMTNDIIALRAHYRLECGERICHDYLGMENGDIPDLYIEASSVYSNYKPWLARLNGSSKWVAYDYNEEVWIQADIQNQTYVSGVLTQGDGDTGNRAGHWITSFKVSTFLENSDGEQTFVQDGLGNTLVFAGNTDADTIVTSYFPEPVYARIVRITCISHAGGTYWQMRFEILGCKQ